MLAKGTIVTPSKAKADAAEEIDVTVQPVDQETPEPVKPVVKPDPDPVTSSVVATGKIAGATVMLTHRSTHESCTVDKIEYLATANAWTIRGFFPVGE